MKQIRLQRGEEIQVNGYVIRAVGIHDAPDQIQVYHPNMNHLIESRRDLRTVLYAGESDRVTVASSLTVGTIGGLLAAPHGSERAKDTARQWLRDNLTYFHPDAAERAVQALGENLTGPTNASQEWLAWAKACGKVSDPRD